MRLIYAAALAAGTLAVPAAAQELTQITTRDGFLQTVSGRDLTRFGITVSVLRSGEIEGRAFGSAVSGSWNWQGAYFCRDLYWGAKRLDPNCQAVAAGGNTIRFVSDRGKGRSADLTIE